jgi:RNA polymerase-binding protein DksA
MSDLTDLQIDDLKARLVLRSRELKDEIRDVLIRSDEQHHKDLAGAVADAGDDAVADMLVDIDTALADRHVIELRDVESALQRMRDGNFGVCVECGTDIGYDRLTVYATTKRCIRCQQRHEQTHFRGATPTL